MTKNPDNLDFMIQNYIDGERNKNIHNFSDSMIDVNQKITNYLIDNCLKEKEKNKYIEDFRAEIGQKLDKIEKAYSEIVNNKSSNDSRSEHLEDER